MRTWFAEAGLKDIAVGDTGEREREHAIGLH
jgi:hypothetical protein